MTHFSSLRLIHFRNYDDLSLTFDGTPAIFYGHNGAGKTNVLEAFSLFAPGKGLRGAKVTDFLNHSTKAPSFALHATLGDDALATGVKPESPSRRTVTLNGKALRSQLDLAHTLSVFWLTPSMDRLLSNDASERRKFFDRLVYHFNPNHGEHLTSLEKTIKERSVLLKEGFYDKAWMLLLEERIVDLSLLINAERQALLEKLNALKPCWEEHFPYPHLSFEGKLETALENHSNIQNLKDFLIQSMADFRKDDAHIGGAKLGAHKSELIAAFRLMQKKAHFCSTGEQKALLISLVLGYSELFIALKERTPILLLDEMVAHLDEKRRFALLDILVNMKMQTMMSGTERELFNGIDGKAQFFYVNEAKVRQEA